MRLSLGIGALLVFSLAACSPQPTRDARDIAKGQPMPAEAYTPDDEINVEVGIKIQARVLFEQKKFKELNELAHRYLSSKETTPTGEPKLKFFYVGLLDYAGYQTSSQSQTPNMSQWGVMLDRVQEWIKLDPSPAAYITLAKFHHHLGWLWRGDGFAVDVSQDAWKPFHDEMALTRSTLEDHKDAAIDPEWFFTMANVAREQPMPKREAEAVFLEAIKNHKYYDRIYETAVLRLMPQWGGSWEAVEEFANAAAENAKDKEGDALYARIYIAVGSCGCSIFRETKVDWSRMRRGFEDILKKYPDEWNRNSFAYYACQAGDRQTTKELFTKISRSFMDAWDNDQATYDRCKAWAEGA